MRFLTFKARKQFCYGLAMAILTALVAVSTTPKDEKYLSNESALAMKILNEQYDMVITEDLLNDDYNSRLITSLLQADVMQFTPGSEIPTNQGLIVSFKENSNGILLVQPIKELSETELKEVAENYTSAIPEASFEIDQNVINTSDEQSDEESIVLEILDVVEEEEVELEENTIEVAVIDSGIQVSHPQFNEVNISISSQANLITDDSNIEDDIGHGTHIAGIIGENAPEAVIKPYKIVDANGGRLSHVIKAIDLAIEDEVEVINMSFGVMEDSYALETLIQKTVDEGIVMVAAAGNFDTSDAFYPAVYEEVIAVGGVYSSGYKMRTSNYGDWVDVAANGYRIHSSIPNDDYEYKDGTSQSTAFVSAEVAELLIENPKLTVEEVKDLLQDNRKVRSGDFEGLPIISGLQPTK